ncbi:MAG: sialidase family protein [Hallella sp.]|uniref:sialidase family protein n=1 Tax=Hallella sp. TaxID=2980186 RepID=UPI00258CE6BC|nr:sialidase family protein [Hallella sp.]MDD7146325.1 sialidase family protein [Hallella sp.]
MDLTHFLVTIRKAAVPAEPQVEIFTTPTTQAIPYRIPAIATAYDGTVVAVADYRYSRVDIGSGRIDLHIRRSHDNGATWDDIMMPEVMRGDGDKTEGHQKAGYGDPCIVGDSESPRMIITACSGTPGFFGGTRTHHQGWARWYSDDNGATWSEPQYIDEEFIYSKFDKSAYGPIRGWFVGSGKICQSKTTKVGTHYRLYCVGSSCRQGSNETANWVLYSDDFGKTWLFLGGCDESPVPGGDEPKAEELPDGSILLSSRCTGGRNFNIFTFSDTRCGQGTWGQVAFSGSGNKGVTALSNACNGEVLLVPVTRKKDKKTMFLLLQSLPFGSGRANVGIYYKALESLADYRTPDAIAKNWDGRHQSSYISSAYSTMTWQKNNTIGFVYEEDTYGTSGGGYTIIYKNYSIEQITDSAFTYNPSVNGDSLTALGMGAVVDAVTSTDNVGTIVGQYTTEAPTW